MGVFKKVLALVIIILIFGQISVDASTYELKSIEEYTKYSKNNLIDTVKNGKKYVTKIDLFIGKITNKKANLLSKKILVIKNKLLNRDDVISEKEETILKILTYIEYKLQERELLKDELLKKNIFKNTLSINDTEKINYELVKIQKNVLKQTVSNFENILGELEHYLNFEEKGHFEAKVNYDYEPIGKSKIELKLNDYISKNSGFDSQFKTKIESIIEAAPKGGDEVKMEINAFLDYIVKEQNYYFLLKNLNIVNDKEILEINSYLEKIKEISAKNKYIKIEDKNTQQIISKLKQFTPENILKQGNFIASKPLFTAYRKDGNKYYLIPSKYACDTVKTISKIFDPFNNKCSDSQYRDLLDEIADSKTEFYIDLSSKNTLVGFESKADGMEKLEGNMIFSEKFIEEINFIATPNQEKYPNEGIDIKFIEGNKLDARIYINKGKFDFSLISTLDGKNRFKSMDLILKSDDEFYGKLKINNKKITGNYSGKSYNEKFVGIISGKMDRNNILSTLKINNQYINSSSYNGGEVNTILEYSYGKYSIDNKYKSEGFISDLKTSFTISKKLLSDFVFDLQISEKESDYDENYKKIYVGEFKKVIDSKIELINKNIKGKTIVYNKDEELLKIINTGMLEEDKFELNNKIEFSYNLFSTYFGTGSMEQNSELNFNIKTDTKSNRNNLNIYTNLKLDDKKVFEFELANKSRKVYKKVKIINPLPNDTIPLKEVFENPNLY